MNIFFFVMCVSSLTLLIIGFIGLVITSGRF